MIPYERASQEEQNGANFSFIAPSSEELLLPILQMYVNGKGRHHRDLTDDLYRTLDRLPPVWCGACEVQGGPQSREESSHPPR